MSGRPEGYRMHRWQQETTARRCSICNVQRRFKSGRPGGLFSFDNGRTWTALERYPSCIATTPPMTSDPCLRCVGLARDGAIRGETIQPLPQGAWAPLARDGSGPCCFDCAAADGLMGTEQYLDFTMARIAIGNDRQEQLRLPGVALGLRLLRPNLAGDLERHHAWLNTHDWFGAHTA